MSEPVVSAATSAASSHPAATGPKNMHGFMSFGVSSMALVFGTAGVGIVSVMGHLGLPPSLSKGAVALSYLVPIALALVGIRHGVQAFLLSFRGIPCHKESEFAAFLGLVIGLAVAGIFVWFGLFASPGPPR